MRPTLSASRRSIAVVAFALGATLGFVGAASADPKVIAKVDGAPVTDEDVAVAMADIGPGLPQKLDQAQRQKYVLEYLIDLKLAAKKAQGVKLGGLNAGVIRSRDEAKARAEALRPVLAELASMSARAIAAELNRRAVPTPNGKPWHATTVIRVQRRLG